MSAWARCNLDGKHDHFKQYAKQKGISAKEALARFGYEEPQVPEGYEHVWQWFFELAGGRAGNGFGWNPISWQEMAAWASLTGTKVTPWLAQCFRAMDQEWLAEAAAIQKKKNGRKHA